MTSVLIYDPITYRPWSYHIERARLAARGVDLVVPRDHGDRDRALAGVDALIVADHLPTSALDHLERCVAVMCYGVGTNAVDGDAARDRGIEVLNVPGFCSEEVAAHALALLLALWRGVPFANSVAAGDWDVVDTPAFRSLRRISTLRVGVIGYGRIGREVARMCRHIGLTVIVSDPYVAASGKSDIDLVELDELLAGSDAVVLCASLSAGSERVIDGKAVDLMPAGSVLVNVARGGLVDEQALLERLRNGHLGGAALDVRANEPPTEPDELRSLPNVVLTPHLAAVSVESDRDLHEFAAARIIDALERHGRLAD